MTERVNWLILFGFAVSAGLLWMVAQKIEWAVFWDALQRVDLLMVIGSAILVSVGIMARAARWNVTAGAPLARYYDFWRATQLGYLGNMIYPARAGEVIRMAAVRSFAGISTGEAVASAIADRISDGLLLGLMLAGMLIGSGWHSINAAMALTVAGTFGMAALALYCFVRWGDRWAGKRLAPILVGFAPLRDRQRLGWIMFLGIVAFSFDFLALFVLLRAFGWAVPFLAAVTLEIFLAAGSSIPSTPGYVGVYQVACVLALGFYGVDDSQAVAFSVVWQIVLLIIFILQGGWVALHYGIGRYR